MKKTDVLSNIFKKIKVSRIIAAHQGDKVVQRADWLVGKTDYFGITLRR